MVWPTGGVIVSSPMQADGTYYVEYFGFGYVQGGTQANGAIYPTAAYFQEIGQNTVALEHALVATNFNGLGLPSSIYYQLMNLLEQADDNFQSELQSTNPIYLGKACVDFFNNDIWAFKVKFTGSENYMIFPIYTFMVKAGLSCQIMIYELPASE